MAGPNDWNDLIVPDATNPQPTNGQNDWSDLVAPQTQPQTNRADTRSPMQRAYPRSFGVRPEQTPAEREWYNLPFFQRLGAVSSNLGRSIPGVGPFIPESEHNELFREAKPVASGYGRIVGHSVPYAAAGTIYPPSLANLPAAMTTGATIEGVGALAEGEPIAPAAIGGAVSAVPAFALSKVISPMSAARVDMRQAGRQFEDLNRRLSRTANEYAEALGGNVNRETRALRTAAEPIVEESQRIFARPPVSLGLTRLPANVENAALGAILGHAHSGRAVTGAILAYLGGHGARFAERSVNRPGLLRDFAENQMANNPTIRAIMQAIAMPTINEQFPANSEPIQTLTGR